MLSKFCMGRIGWFFDSWMTVYLDLVSHHFISYRALMAVRTNLWVNSPQKLGVLSDFVMITTLLIPPTIHETTEHSTLLTPRAGPIVLTIQFHRPETAQLYWKGYNSDVLLVSSGLNSPHFSTPPQRFGLQPQLYFDNPWNPEQLCCTDMQVSSNRD